MQRTTRRATLGLLLAAPAAHAQPRTLRMVVPFPPGGTTDVLARMLQPVFSEAFGAAVVIDNRAGAGGLVGTQEIVRAAPDGLTFGWIISTHASNPALVKAMPFDPVADVSPLVLVAKVANMVAVNPGLPAQDLAGLLALARTKRGGVTYGISGYGTSQHFSGVTLALRSGAELTPVVYRGGGPAYQAAIAGEIDMVFGQLPPTLPFIRNGTLRALAVTSAERAPQVPELPTIAESGFPGFEIVEWYGLAAPPGLPPAVRERLEATLLGALRRPEVTERLEQSGARTSFVAGDAFGAFIRAEIARYAEVVRAGNVRID